MNDISDGANHEFPHEHEWKDGVRGPAQPVPSEFSWGAALHGIVDNVNETTWGATTYYEYNKNRLSQVQIDGANARNTASNVNVSYEYYDDGKLKSVTYPALTDGSILKSEYVYDGLSRLTSLTNYKGTDVLSSYIYTYDSNGNILTTTETVGSTQNSVAYTYDKLNRIASVAGTKGADSYYEYDARGNRKVNFEQIDYLSEESAIFIYDAEDNLDRSQVGDNTTYFEYSANGYRYFKKENSNYPEYYVYDPNGRLHAIAAAVTLSMTDGSTLSVMFPITQYIWGPDRVLAKIDKLTNTSYYYLYNGHGDVVQIVDTSGAVKNTYDYDVWGNFITKEETIENHFTYFGQTYDETTGLYYLRARYYDPTTGRFTQQDPAEDGYNWYIYGNNNPIKYIDPNGLYNREKVKDYIENWWDDRNNDYYSYRTDCANFVSQCLYAGDIEMKKEWYSYKEGKISGFNIMGMFHNNYKYKWNVAESWRLAKKQFEYFSNPYHGFIEGEVLQLWSEEGMKYNIRHNNIQVGDLMYFADKDTREIYHASVL